MPIGAYRLNALSKFTGSTAPANSSTTSLTNVSWNNDLYGVPLLSYCGADSSNRPVFMYGYEDSTNGYAKVILIRINSDLTITQGSSTNITSAAINTGSYAVQAVSEYPNRNWGWCFYLNTTGYVTAKTFSIDKDNLSIGTPGTAVTIGSAGGTASLFCAAYAGEAQKMWLSIRNNYGSLYLSTRTDNTTTITAGTVNFNGNLGDQSVLHSVKGFGYYLSGVTIYRYVGHTYGDNLEIGYANGTSPSTILQQATFLGSSYTGGNVITPIGTGTWPSGTDINRFIFSGKSSNSLYVRAATVTWRTSGTTAPAISTGTILSLTDDVDSGYWSVVPGFANGEAYAVYKKNGVSNWYYRKLTVSTNTISEGAAVEITNPPTSPAALLQNATAIASTSTGNWIAGVLDNSSSSNPDFIAIKVS